MTVPGLALAVVAAACIGTSDYLYRATGPRSDAPGTWLAVQSIAFAAVMIASAALVGVRPSSAMLYGLATGPINLAAFYCVLRALSRGDALALAPVARLNFVVTALLTVAILDEALSWRRILGLALAVAAVLCVGGHYARIGGDRRALALAIAAMALSGVAGLLFKLGLAAGATPVELTLAQAAGFVVVAGCLALSPAERRASRRAPLSTGVVCGVLIACFYLSLTHAFVTTDAVVVAPVAQLGFVLTAGLAVARLGERLTPARAWALALAVGAVLALAGA